MYSEKLKGFTARPHEILPPVNEVVERVLKERVRRRNKNEAVGKKRVRKKEEEKKKKNVVFEAKADATKATKTFETGVSLRDQLKAEALSRYGIELGKLSAEAKLGLLKEHVQTKGEAGDTLRQGLDELQAILHEDPDPQFRGQIKEVMGRIRGLVGGINGTDKDILLSTEYEVFQHVAHSAKKYGYFGPNGVDNAAREIGFTGWGQRVRTPGKFYDDADAVVQQLPGPLKAKFQEIEDWITNNPAKYSDPRWLEKVATEVSNPAEFGILDPPARAIVDKIMDRINTLHKEAERQRGFSNLFLDLEDMNALVSDPEWKIENLLRDTDQVAILFPDGVIPDELKSKMRRFYSYMVDASYIRDIKAEALRRGELPATDRDALLTTADRESWIDKQGKAFKTLNEKVMFHEKIGVSYGMIRGIGDPEKISQSLGYVGTRGLQHYLKQNGGLNEIAFNKYVALYKEAAIDKNGNPQRITGEVIDNIRTRVNLEMKADKELYNDQYVAAYNSKEVSSLTDIDCEEIVRQAEHMVFITQQNMVAMLEGLGPAGGGDLSSFASADTSEKLLAAMDIQRWFFEKWGNLTPGQKVIWSNVCRVAGTISGGAEQIEARMRGVVRGTPAWNTLCGEAFGEERKVAELLSYNPDGSQNHHPPESFREVSVERLRDRLIVVQGEKIVGHILDVYDHFSSGWRINTHLLQIDRIFPTSGENMALGMRLRALGAQLRNAESGDKRTLILHGKDGLDHGTKTLIGVLNKVARYRPQELMKFLADGKDTQLNNWFGNLRTNGRLTVAALGRSPGSTNIERIDELYNYVRRPFQNINELLAVRGIEPIDYSGAVSLSVDQRRIVELVCRSTGIQTNPDSFLALMKDVSSHVGVSDNILKLTTSEYYHIYERTKWIDDARLGKIEIPHDAPGGHPEPDYNTPLSILFSDPGMGDVDPLVRSWRDGNTGFKMVYELYGLLNSDEKLYHKGLLAVVGAVRSYQGHVPATRAALYLLGGWGATAKTDAINDWFYLNGLPNSSAFKRVAGDKGASMGLNELEEFIDKHDFELIGKMKNEAPELFAEIEHYLGITYSADEGAVLSRLPLYLYRSRIILVIAAIILAAEFGKSLQEELKPHR